MTITVIIAVLVLGLVLLFVEVAIVPGFGVTGALGLLALAAGATAAWTELGPLWGGVTGGVSVVAAGAMLYWLPKSRLGRKMVLEHSQAEAISQKDRSELVGRRGITVTPLRPIGRVRFGSDEVDVMTEGEYVDSNQEVEVMSVEGTRVVVRTSDVR
ncbi:MAG: NfeD family protein [Deltaproteobacteria bacterium]|nr:NfeD family protein [Deltaproteobacteria bacterium]